MRMPLPLEPDLEGMVGEQQRTNLLPALRLWLSADGPEVIYVYGEPGCGRTYMMMACQRWLEEHGHGHDMFYVSLQEEGLEVSVLDGLERYQWLFMDHVETVQGQVKWETALFELCNRHQGHNLLIAGRVLPGQACIIPDLASRWMGGLVYAMGGWNDDELGEFLAQAAAQRGLRLSTEQRTYILQRGSRSPGGLLRFLDQLDHYTLQEKRPVTLPVLRALLDR